ncbi:hypothetical protein [Occallatibacter savannae]|uniref:hypothetical protein n=1 Tax=Occallatibacter savannae TaxID=1002691 RepID=UPI0013A55F58|nr:hypothetical protein [Occallatibacter savannae]
MPRAVSWIWMYCAVHVALGAIAYAHFLITGSYQYLTWYFVIPGTLFFLVTAAAEFYLAFECRAGFDVDEPMRMVWTTITLTSSARFLAATLIFLDHWRFARVPASPLLVLGLTPPQSLAEIGEVIGGPIAMVLLAFALGRVLAIQREFGILRGLTRADIVLICLIILFTLGEAANIERYLGPAYPRRSVAQAILWMSDPILGFLLVEAVLIRRSAHRIGIGLVSKCWGMYVIAIMATLAGDAAIWGAGEELFTQNLVPLTWYIWFFVAAAYASAPAYQLAAMKLPQLPRSELNDSQKT